MPVHKRVGFLLTIHYLISAVWTESNSRQLDIPALESYFSNVRPKLRGIDFDAVVRPRSNQFENNPSMSPAEKLTYVQRFGPDRNHHPSAGSSFSSPHNTFARRPGIQSFNRLPAKSSRSTQPNSHQAVDNSFNAASNYDWIPLSPLEKKRIPSQPKAPLNIPTKFLTVPPITSQKHLWTKGSSNTVSPHENHGRSLPFNNLPTDQASRFHVGESGSQLKYNQYKQSDTKSPIVQWNVGSSGRSHFGSSGGGVTGPMSKLPFKNSVPIVQHGKPIHVPDRQTGLKRAPSYQRELNEKPTKGTSSLSGGLAMSVTDLHLNVPKGYDKKYPDKGTSVLISKRPDTFLSLKSSNHPVQTKDLISHTKKRTKGFSSGRHLSADPIRYRENHSQLRENYEESFSDDVGMISSFSYFRNPNLFRDFEKNFDAEEGRFKIVKQFNEHLDDQTGFPGNYRNLGRKNFRDTAKLYDEAEETV